MSPLIFPRPGLIGVASPGQGPLSWPRRKGSWELWRCQHPPDPGLSKNTLYDTAGFVLAPSHVLPRSALPACPSPFLWCRKAPSSPLCPSVSSSCPGFVVPRRPAGTEEDVRICQHRCRVSISLPAKNFVAVYDGYLVNTELMTVMRIWKLLVQENLGMASSILPTWC